MRGHHAKQNKSDRKRQIACDLTYMCNLPHPTPAKKKANTEKQKVENRTVVIRSWRLGEMGRCLSKGKIL